MSLGLPRLRSSRTLRRSTCRTLCLALCRTPLRLLIASTTCLQHASESLRGLLLALLQSRDLLVARLCPRVSLLPRYAFPLQLPVACRQSFTQRSYFTLLILWRPSRTSRRLLRTCLFGLRSLRLWCR